MKKLIIINIFSLELVYIALDAKGNLSRQVIKLK